MCSPLVRIKVLQFTAFFQQPVEERSSESFNIRKFDICKLNGPYAHRHPRPPSLLLRKWCVFQTRSLTPLRPLTRPPYNRLLPGRQQHRRPRAQDIEQRATYGDVLEPRTAPRQRRRAFPSDRLYGGRGSRPLSPPLPHHRLRQAHTRSLLRGLYVFQVLPLSNAARFTLPVCTQHSESHLPQPSMLCSQNVGWPRTRLCVRFTSHLYFSRSLFSCCLALLLHRTCLPVRTFRLSFTTTDDIEMPLSESFPYDPHMDECKIIAPHQDKRS